MTRGLLTYRVINDEVPAASGGHDHSQPQCMGLTPPAEITESGKTLAYSRGRSKRAGVAVTHAWFQLGKGIFTGAFLVLPTTTRGNQ